MKQKPDMLEKLVDLSRYYGANPEFLLAGGGNSSFKTPDILHIKCSGIAMAEVNRNDFIKMKRPRLNAILKKTYPALSEKREAAVLKDIMDSRAYLKTDKRPSVETLLHNIIDKKFVVHTHPALLNGVTCGKKGEEWVCKNLGEQIIWVPYIDPGYKLTKLVEKLLEKHRREKGRPASILLLQNHGVFVGGDTPGQIKSATRDLLNKISARVPAAPDFSEANFNRERAVQLAPAVRTILKKPFGRSCTAIFHTNRETLRVVQSATSFFPVSSAYSPDHVVYYGPAPLFVPYRSTIQAQYTEISKAIEKFIIKFSCPPKIIAIQKLGVYAASETRKTAESALALFLDTVKVSIYNKAFGGPKFMTTAQIQFIHSWEAERYRRKFHQSNSNGGRCRGKTAVVTGGAQGLGQGIAEALLKNGANVVIADLNGKLAAKTAKKFTQDFDPGRIMPVQADVSDPEGAERIVNETVLNFGGLDVFVSNAGVLRAGALDQMETETFRFVTRVNYEAFFHCARAASRIMRIQNRFEPEAFYDIIQINSKSGLVGSKNNFAYAGAKFGGIGLVQSFALELVDYQIKVNAVCPGNYFEGPLWSDPVNGLFVQYLKTGKVPGAKTIDDVKRFYESKIPMKRGCKPADIEKAIFYIMEQEYETGQAIPVTGGQIQLK